MKAKLLINDLITEIEGSSNYTDLIYLRARIEDAKNALEKKMDSMKRVASKTTILKKKTVY